VGCARPRDAQVLVVADLCKRRADGRLDGRSLGLDATIPAAQVRAGARADTRVERAAAAALDAHVAHGARDDPRRRVDARKAAVRCEALLVAAHRKGLRRCPSVAQQQRSTEGRERGSDARLEQAAPPNADALCP